MSCAIYSKGDYYMVGVFWDPYFSDRLVRSGFSLGLGCYYTGTISAWEPVRSSMGNFYDWPRGTANGSLYFDEIGVKRGLTRRLFLIA